jgi:hypothetical protein
MRKSTDSSWLAPAAAIAVAIAATPLALVAQDARPPQAIREFSVRDVVVMSPRVSRVINEAIGALNAGRFAAARKEMGELQLDRLSAYERAQAELVLFNIAFAEQDFDEGRQHLFNALESGGLDAQETAGAREQFKRDARLGTPPPE